MTGVSRQRSGRLPPSHSRRLHNRQLRSARFAESRNFLFRIAFSGSGKLLAASCRDRAVYLLDVRSGKEVWRHPGGGGTFYSLAFRGDEQLATGDGLGTALVWDVGSL